MDIKIIEVVSKTFTITLTEEEVELMIALTGGLRGETARGNPDGIGSLRGEGAFELDLDSPLTYPMRALKANFNDLRKKLTDPLWELLNSATRAKP